MYQPQNEAEKKEENYDYNSGAVGSNDNFNYYSQPQSHSQAYAQAPLNPQVAPEYPTHSVQFGNNPFSASANLTSGSTGIGTGNVNSFDNVDISRNNRFSGGTPFETVHEFVSVSNKVSNIKMKLGYYNYYLL